VQFHDLVSLLNTDIKDSVWPAFAPEIVLSATVMAMLIVRLFRFGRLVPAFLMALAGIGIAFYYTAPWLHLTDSPLPRREIFTGMLVYDSFTAFFRSILLVFGVLLVVLTRLSRTPDPDDAIDFYCLILGSMVGMCLMASANHLLMVFMAVEMASVPSYALAGILRFQRKSSEAALKYSVYGAGAAGVMLYGISLIAGVVNSAHLPTIAARLATELAAYSSQEQLALVLGGLMVMVGLAFKLSAVPFHFWCPDVFEGATAEVDAFLSVASKAAALALLVRVALGVGLLPPVGATPTASVSALESSGGYFAVADVAASSADAASPNQRLEPVRRFASLLVGFLAAITCTFGNLAAYGQTNLKRLMAYSTIAHAGYMMMAVPPALALATRYPPGASEAIAGLGIYVAVYVLMNLGAFAIIAFFRNAYGSEEISDCSGLIRRSPIVVVIFSLVLFSLVGLPPLAGFIGKFKIFASLAEAYGKTNQADLAALLVIGCINTAISLFYYLKVVKVMTIDPETDSTPVPRANLVSLVGGAFLFLLAVPIATLMVYWNPLNEWTQAAARQLF
jgi:NADH-quinone oxidoreductase subunit N